MIEVVVSRLGLDSSTQSYVVILQEKEGQRLLPIWIGQPEAESIAMQMHNVKRPRPLTHDLCKSLIVGLGGAGGTPERRRDRAFRRSAGARHGARRRHL